MLRVCVKYSMCDLICDVISCCAWSYDMDIIMINVYEKIMTENQNIKKRENMEIK